MGKLHKYFENTLTKIGFIHTELPEAVFYRTPIGIRFEIGGEEDVYLPDDKGINPIYVENAFCRAKTLFHDLPCRPNLLIEIIKGDIGGFSCLCSNVYLLNTESGVLYHLYDDRGADIVAMDKHLLLPLYQKYNDWILQYDKERIDQLFSD